MSLVAIAPETDIDDDGDAARTRRHHDDAVDEVDRLGDRVGDEDHRRAGLAADAQQLGLHVLAGHLVERPNGSSINSSSGCAASARAMATRCCMPPDSCHGMWSANRAA